MNRLTWGIALAFMLTINVHGQQSPPPAVNSTPAPVTDFAPSAPGTTAAGPDAADSLSEPAGNIETQGDSALGSGLSQQPRGATAPAPAANAIPAPSGERAAGFEQFDGGPRRIADGQRGELGVWLIESGGPGVEIRRITAGSAADLAGLQQGDVILKINGRGALSPHGIARMIREMPAGQAAVVEYWRDGQANEMEIVLQPARERYEVAFRGDEPRMDVNRAGSDLESRTMRLEEQLALVTQELRQLRQEITQLRTSASSQTGLGRGIGEATTAAGFEAGATTDATIAEPGAAITPPAATEPADVATEDDAFGASTTEPAATPIVAPEGEPAAEPTTEPAAEPATEPADESDDLFEEPAATEAEPATEETAPTDDEAATEEAPATEADSDDLFE